jgi:hypothetical protein
VRNDTSRGLGHCHNKASKAKRSLTKFKTHSSTNLHIGRRSFSSGPTNNSEKPEPLVTMVVSNVKDKGD